MATPSVPMTGPGPQSPNDLQAKLERKHWEHKAAAAGTELLATWLAKVGAHNPDEARKELRLLAGLGKYRGLVSVLRDLP